MLLTELLIAILYKGQAFPQSNASMSTSVKLLVTGVTGYVGGSLLSELVKNPGYKLIVLLRKAGQAEKLNSVFPDVDTTIGSLDDLELLQGLASEVDGTFYDPTPMSVSDNQTRHIDFFPLSRRRYCVVLAHRVAQGIHRRPC